jgi:[ribosomal protein S5]-alanine N-acetyltransferase
MTFPTIATIRAERVVIRSVEEADLDDLMKINGDDDVTQFLPYDSWSSRDDAMAWLVRMQALGSAGTGQQLVIEETSQRRVIGTVLLFKFDASSARLELGYVVGQAHWRHGFAKEAIHAVCSHAFQHLSIRRIEAEVDPRNIGSNRLLKSVGFVQEGLLRKRWVDRGEASDSCFYGCLAEEWRHSPLSP